MSKASEEFRGVAIDYDNALAEVASEIINGNDPSDDQRESIEEDRYLSSDYVLGRLSSSLPKFIQYIIVSLKHAGCEVEAPTSKAEAIALIMSIVNDGDPYNERDEDQFPIPKYRYDRLHRVLNECSFGIPSIEPKFATSVSAGDEIRDTFDDDILNNCKTPRSAGERTEVGANEI
ncbi:hypothetical protein [Rhodoferax sp.]|uniref:hypothetical protein n=1 Tax=Rhodoferax sp. TaxID=50421 RepID=UPI002749F080|nr:hypothetical protein [Rhodoferax sp.]